MNFYKRILLHYIETLLFFTYNAYFISIINITLTYHACSISIISITRNIDWVILFILLRLILNIIVNSSVIIKLS